MGHAQGVLRGLARQVRNRDGTADDRPPEAEPDGSQENARQQGPVEQSEQKACHSAKLTRDGTLRRAEEKAIAPLGFPCRLVRRRRAPLVVPKTTTIPSNPSGSRTAASRKRTSTVTRSIRPSNTSGSPTPGIPTTAPKRSTGSPRSAAWTSSPSRTTTRSTAACRFSTGSPDLDDFFISEEVETWFPDTRQRIHVNVFDIDEKQHEEIQRRRPQHLRPARVPARGADHRLGQPHVPELPDAQLPAALLRGDAADVRHLRGQERRDDLAPQPPGRGPDGRRAGEARRGLARRRLRRPHARAARPRLHGGRGGDRLGVPREGPHGRLLRLGRARWDSGCCSRTSTGWSSGTTGASSTGRTRSSRASRRRATSRSPPSALPSRRPGVPFAVTTLNYLKQIFVTKTVGQELLEHWEGSGRTELGCR